MPPKCSQFCLLSVAIFMFLSTQLFFRNVLLDQKGGHAPQQYAAAFPSSVNARKLLDEDPIHIFTAICIRHEMTENDPGLTSIRSIIAARDIGASHNRRYVFHIVLDKWVASLINYNTSLPIPHGKIIAKDFLATFHDV